MSGSRIYSRHIIDREISRMLKGVGQIPIGARIRLVESGHPGFVIDQWVKLGFTQPWFQVRLDECGSKLWRRRDMLEVVDPLSALAMEAENA